MSLFNTVRSVLENDQNILEHRESWQTNRLHTSVCMIDMEERQEEGGGRAVGRAEDEIREEMEEEVRAEEVTEDKIDV